MTYSFRSLAGVTALGISLSLAGPALSFAQPFAAQEGAGQWGGGGQRRMADPDTQVKRLTKALKLTSDQQDKIKSILTDRSNQMKSIREDSSLQPEDRRAKMQSLRSDSESKIDAVLNDDQKQKYKDMQDQMRQRMRDHQGGGNANPPQN